MDKQRIYTVLYRGLVMNQHDIEKAFGHCTRGDGYYITHCPECKKLGRTTPHFYIYDKSGAHCFRCNQHYSAKALYNLMGVEQGISAINWFNPVSIKKDKPLELPQGLVKIQENDCYYNYLIKRGFDWDIINTYKILGCGNYVFIPCITKKRLIYYQMRYIWPIRNDFIKKYKSPQVSRKAIIFNEDVLNTGEDIIICEGIFSAISSGKNAIALLGKELLPAQMDKILATQHYNLDRVIYLALDGGCNMECDVIGYKLAKWGINCKQIVLPFGKDPNDLLKSGIPLSNYDLKTYCGLYR